jgi:hypothetical protein
MHRDRSDMPIYSELYNQDTFYRVFTKDLNLSQREVIIESPFITAKRMAMLMPVFTKLRQRGVRIVVNTRHPDEHDDTYREQAFEAIESMQMLDIKVLYTRGHHRKLAIIDRQVVYEGSLNILSFNDSCEIMRKMTSETLARQLVRFIAIDKYIKEF